ncbi:MAG TPA: hypothetical protein PLZ15_03945 [Melioribacteraceae bacterium]|nr:hypothetical protein [Melioribacteraceae bacterium]
MAGLFIAITGLVFGTLCSKAAIKFDRFPKNWFLIGFISGPIGLAMLYIIARIKSGDYEAGVLDRTILGTE